MNVEFRAKDADNGMWRYGFYVLHRKTMLCIASDEEIKANEEHIIIFDGCSDWNLPVPWYKSNIDPKTLGQFIGLKDCNGKKAYDGDIVLDERKRWWVVYAAPGGFRVCTIKEFITTGENPIIENGLSEPQNAAWLEQSCSIVGNIYDNPELIKEYNDNKEMKNHYENQAGLCDK